jgi:hypothetical protein
LDHAIAVFALMLLNAQQLIGRVHFQAQGLARLE